MHLVGYLYEEHFNLLVYVHLILVCDRFTDIRYRHWFIFGVQSLFSFQKRFDVELQTYRTFSKVRRIFFLNSSGVHSNLWNREVRNSEKRGIRVYSSRPWPLTPRTCDVWLWAGIAARVLNLWIRWRWLNRQHYTTTTFILEKEYFVSIRRENWKT